MHRQDWKDRGKGGKVVKAEAMQAGRRQGGREAEVK